jgi:hypothetical protein
VVSLVPLATGWLGMLAAEQALLEQLEPPRRAAVVLILIGLCLLGVLMVVLTMLAGRWVRGLKIHKPRHRPSVPPKSEAPSRTRRAEGSSQSETMPGLPLTGETTVDPSA